MISENIPSLNAQIPFLGNISFDSRNAESTFRNEVAFTVQIVFIRCNSEWFPQVLIYEMPNLTLQLMPQMQWLLQCK